MTIEQSAIDTTAKAIESYNGKVWAAYAIGARQVASGVAKIAKLERAEFVEAVATRVVAELARRAREAAIAAGNPYVPIEAAPTEKETKDMLASIRRMVTVGNWLRKLSSLGASSAELSALDVTQTQVTDGARIKPLNAAELVMPDVVTVAWLEDIGALVSRDKKAEKATRAPRTQGDADSATGSADTGHEANKPTPAEALAIIMQMVPVVYHHDGCFETLTSEQREQLRQDLGLVIAQTKKADAKELAASV